MERNRALPSFWEWLTKSKKPLSRMSRAELRRQEILLEKDRAQLLDRVQRIALGKKELFERGAAESGVELRRVLAQEFEMKTTEQLMLARQLNVRSKEMLTVSRLRMLRENAERARSPGKLGLVSEVDLLRLGRLIETDSVKAEVYQERLDEILAVGNAASGDGGDGLSDAGRSVMKAWQRLDVGDIQDRNEAFEEADRVVRERHAAADGA